MGMTRCARPVRAGLVALALLGAGGCDLLEGDLAGWIVQRSASTQANFRASRSIAVLLEPSDLELYRAQLPAQLEMPEHPMVAFRVTDNLEVGPWPLTPYQLASVSLRCAWRGEEGWHVVTMPENQWIAIWSGRTMGFPKYRADVRLEPEDGGWTGEVRWRGERVLRLDFRTDSEAPVPTWMREVWSMGGPVFNLMPPAEGPEVKTIRTEASDPGETRSERGRVRVAPAPGQPWGGLVPDGSEATGSWTEWRGGTSLAPEG